MNPTLFMYGAAAVIIYSLTNKVFQKVGLTDTKEEKQGDKAESNLGRMNFWKPDFWVEAQNEAKKKNKSIIVVGDDDAKELSYDIYYAKGYLLYDNEATVVGAIRSLGSKASISRLSQVFYHYYKLDLYSYMQEFLESPDWIAINNHIKTIPDYNTK